MIKERFRTVIALFAFLKMRKRWFLIPLITVLILTVVFLIAMQALSTSPFFYTLF